MRWHSGWWRAARRHPTRVMLGAGGAGAGEAAPCATVRPIVQVSPRQLVPDAGGTCRTQVVAGVECGGWVAGGGGGAAAAECGDRGWCGSGGSVPGADDGRPVVQGALRRRVFRGTADVDSGGGWCESGWWRRTRVVEATGGAGGAAAVGGRTCGTRVLVRHPWWWVVGWCGTRGGGSSGGAGWCGTRGGGAAGGVVGVVCWGGGSAAGADG